MILNQDKQAKLHEELDQVIGSDRMITQKDKANLPYLCANINAS
jgi:cytochrome P450 family 33